MLDVNETGEADTSVEDVVEDVPAESVDAFNLEDLINTHF